MTHFCEVRSTFVAGHAEHGNDAEQWAVVTTADPEWWITTFGSEAAAIWYRDQLNLHATKWMEANR